VLARNEAIANARTWWTKLSDAGVEAISESGTSPLAMFTFARILRGWTWTAENLTAADVADYIERMYALGCPADAPTDNAWDELGLNESGDGRAEFLDAWNKVRLPIGVKLFDYALEAAKKHPFIPTVQHSPKYVQFVSIAAHLQRCRRKGQAILLPVEHLAAQLGVSAMNISRYRVWAMEAGILKSTSAAAFRAGVATTFLFQLRQFDATGHQLATPAEEEEVRRRQAAKVAAGRARAAQGKRDKGRYVSRKVTSRALIIESPDQHNVNHRLTAPGAASGTPPAERPAQSPAEASETLIKDYSKSNHRLIRDYSEGRSLRDAPASPASSNHPSAGTAGTTSASCSPGGSAPPAPPRSEYDARWKAYRAMSPEEQVAHLLKVAKSSAVATPHLFTCHCPTCRPPICGLPGHVVGCLCDVAKQMRGER
jgi:hypothetical protein